MILELSLRSSHVAFKGMWMVGWVRGVSGKQAMVVAYMGVGDEIGEPFAESR